MLEPWYFALSDIQETEIAGKKVFSVADGYLIACFDKDVTEETVKAIAPEAASLMPYSVTQYGRVTA